MSKLKICLYHILVTLLGSIIIGIYFWYKGSILPPNAEFAKIVLAPLAAMYSMGFSILCLISLLFFMIKNAKKKS